MTAVGPGSPQRPLVLCGGRLPIAVALQRRQSETLVEAGIDEYRSACVKRRQLLFCDIAGEPHRILEPEALDAYDELREVGIVAIAAGQHQLRVGTLGDDRAHRLEEER